MTVPQNGSVNPPVDVPALNVPSPAAPATVVAAPPAAVVQAPVLQAAVVQPVAVQPAIPQAATAPVAVAAAVPAQAIAQAATIIAPVLTPTADTVTGAVTTTAPQAAAPQAAAPKAAAPKPTSPVAAQAAAPAKATPTAAAAAAPPAPISIVAPAASAAPAAKKKPAGTPAAKAAPSSTNAAAASPAAKKTAAPAAPLTFLQRSHQRMNRVPGYAVSMGLHILVFSMLSLIVLPAKERNELFQTIISETIVPQEVNEKLDETTIVPETDTSIPQLEVDSQIVSSTPSAFDLDVSDAAPQLEGPDLGGGIGTGLSMPKGGGGGELAGRSVKARGALIASQGGTAASEVAVKGSLKWLARHQRADGSWSFKHGPDDPGTLDNPNGATGMALLAFLGGGHTHKAGDYQKQVGNGLNYLVSHMTVTGAGGDLRMAGDGQGMYTQGICTIALCEAYALSKDKTLKQPTQLAVNFIVNAQDPKGGGWRYQPGQAGDTSVVGWQIMALKSAKIAKLQIPNKTIGKATFFLNSVQAEGGSKYGYDQPGALPGTSSVGLLCRMYLGWTPKNPGLVKGVEYLGSVGPQPANMYFNYYATQVLHHWGGEPWTKWNNVMREYLVKSQEKSGDALGSWKPVGGGHDEVAGGRLYRTCLSVMTLEVYYRHLPLYQRETIKVDF